MKVVFERNIAEGYCRSGLSCGVPSCFILTKNLGRDTASRNPSLGLATRLATSSHNRKGQRRSGRPTKQADDRSRSFLLLEDPDYVRGPSAEFFGRTRVVALHGLGSSIPRRSSIPRDGCWRKCACVCIGEDAARAASSPHAQMGNGRGRWSRVRRWGGSGEGGVGRDGMGLWGGSGREGGVGRGGVGWVSEEGNLDGGVCGEDAGEDDGF